MVDPAFTAARRVMGTNAEIKIADPIDPQTAQQLFAVAWERFDTIDAIFSTYDVNSQISRLGRGEIGLDSCHPDVRLVLQLCESVKAASGGAFDVYAAARTMPALEMQRSNLPNARPLEPSGMVKGWAIGEVAELFWMHGLQNFFINVGGDVVASGLAHDESPWRVGIRHPDVEGQLMAVVEVRNAAVATSGLYLRGDHIVGAAGSTPSHLKSLTVVGPDIVLADAYATAAFAMGADGIEWVADLDEFSVLAADGSGQTHYDEGMSTLITLV